MSRVRQHYLQTRSFTDDWTNFRTLETDFPDLDWDGAGEGLPGWEVVDERPIIRITIGKKWEWPK